MPRSRRLALAVTSKGNLMLIVLVSSLSFLLCLMVEFIRHMELKSQKIVPTRAKNKKYTYLLLISFKQLKTEMNLPVIFYTNGVRRLPLGTINVPLSGSVLVNK